MDTKEKCTGEDFTCVICGGKFRYVNMMDWQSKIWEHITTEKHQKAMAEHIKTCPCPACGFRKEHEHVKG